MNSKIIRSSVFFFAFAIGTAGGFLMGKENWVLASLCIVASGLLFAIDEHLARK